MKTKKTCSKCKEQKLINEFHKSKASKDGHHHYCKECNSKDKKNRYATNEGYRIRQRDKQIQYNYNLTPEELNIKFKNQNESCAVCDKKLILYNMDTHIDHDHETGKVRDILCRSCNHILGQTREDIEYIKKIINYLELHKNK